MEIWEDERRNKGRGMSAAEKRGMAEEIVGTVKDYGTAYFLEAISEKIGQLEIMKETLPKSWKKIFIMACYLLVSDKAVMYCNEQIEKNECMEAGSMTSQRISELLTEFGYNERCKFYEMWYRHIREKEYLALDITSVSSYSENIDFMEWGHNRDGEKLPQANVCMLFGEKSRLPVYQTIYSGSLRDVTTLESTLAEFSAIVGTRDIMLVMDKGFFSVKNTNMLLRKKEGECYKFLLPVAFTCNFAKDRIIEERSGIDSIENVILTSGTPVRGVHRYLKWGNSETWFHTHVFFNPEKAVKERNDLYDHVTRLKTMASANPNDSKLQKEFTQYLLIDKSENANRTSVDIRKNIIEEELHTTGWFVLVSNHIDDSQAAYDMYRAKDVVEKSFFQYKHSLGLNRFHVHSDERLLNKSFVAFIALILSSHIHSVMKQNQLYISMSFDKLLSILAKLKVAFVNNSFVLSPLTKDHKIIFDSFDIDFPASSFD